MRFCKIQDGRRRSKFKNRPNLTPKITFWLSKSFPFIRFSQNLAWTYYLTLGTSLRKNFSFFSKSKMAAAAITANYEIAHNLKSIQLRAPIFFPRPMFSMVRNAMKLSFGFYDLGNYLKIQNCCEIGVFRLIHEALYFCSICNNLDSVHRIQTNFGMDILLDPRNKPAKEFFHFFQNPRWLPAVKNFRRVILFQCFCNNFDSVNRIQTKFVMNILLHPRNNHA